MAGSGNFTPYAQYFRQISWEIIHGNCEFHDGRKLAYLNSRHGYIDSEERHNSYQRRLSIEKSSWLAEMLEMNMHDHAVELMDVT